MFEEEKLPDSLIGRVKMLKSILVAVARGENAQYKSEKDHRYGHLRCEFMNDPKIKPDLPDFVSNHQSLSEFWPFIKAEASTYDERAQIISEAFKPLIDRLEGLDHAPSDGMISEVLRTFDEEGVHAVWSKALERRTTDPEGAITTARTLLETVIKHILKGLSINYTDRDDLPKLYNKVAKPLNLAPNQHSEEPIKSILGSVMNLVNSISTLRNRLSDSHGRLVHSLIIHQHIFQNSP